MSKKIWVPVVMGVITAAIGFLITFANLVIYFGVKSPTGLPIGYDVREVFMTICASLGGPLAAVFAVLQFPFIGLHLSLPAAGIAAIMLDRFIAGIVVVFLYKFMYERIKNLPLFLLLWIVVVYLYYTIAINIQFIVEVFMQGAPFFQTYWENLGALFTAAFPPNNIEPIITYVITALVWLVVPRHSRKPLWYAPKAATTTESNRT